MADTPTPKQVAKTLPMLLRRIPVAVRGWVYLGLVIVAVIYIGATAWRSGLSTDQLAALALALIGAMAKSNATGD